MRGANIEVGFYNDRIEIISCGEKARGLFEKAEKYQKERYKIIEDNENLHNEVEQI